MTKTIKTMNVTVATILAAAILVPSIAQANSGDVAYCNALVQKYERHVAIGSEGMPGIGGDDNQVTRFAYDVNAADGVDTTPRVDDEHFAAGMAMLGCASDRRNSGWPPPNGRLR